MPTSRWFAVGSARESDREAGRRAADEALVHDDARLLVAFCSPSWDLTALARQIWSRSKGVPLIGCTTAGEILVAAGIASDAPLGIGVRHGWHRVGEAMLVTHSEGNLVYALDDRPALDVYLEHVGAPEPGGDNIELFIELAAAHPLGLTRHGGEEQVRGVIGAGVADRSLSCIAAVPQGGLVWVMTGDAESALRATDAACGDSLAALKGQPPLGMVAFDCVGRRSVLGEKATELEIDRLLANSGGAPVAGFYTYGEIARTHGMRGFHNQCLVVLSIA